MEDRRNKNKKQITLLFVNRIKLPKTFRIQTSIQQMSEKETNPAEVETTEAAVAVETQTTEKEASHISEAQANPEKFLQEFDWHNYEEGIEQVDDKKLAEFEKLVSENFVDTLDDEVVEGVVIHLTDRDAIIDINAKSEGVISLN